jgi:ABC-type Fe3+ transport system permease subunit
MTRVVLWCAVFLLVIGAVIVAINYIGSGTGFRLSLAVTHRGNRSHRHITIPLLWPGIFSAAVFAMPSSWGNFCLTYSLAGSTLTPPTFIFSGMPLASPLYPALATVFIPGNLLVILANRLRRT